MKTSVRTTRLDFFLTCHHINFAFQITIIHQAKIFRAVAMFLYSIFIKNWCNENCILLKDLSPYEISRHCTEWPRCSCHLSSSHGCHVRAVNFGAYESTEMGRSSI